MPFGERLSPRQRLQQLEYAFGERGDRGMDSKIVAGELVMAMPFGREDRLGGGLESLGRDGQIEFANDPVEGRWRGLEKLVEIDHNTPARSGLVQRFEDVSGPQQTGESGVEVVTVPSRP